MNKETLPVGNISPLSDRVGAAAEGTIPADAEFFQDHFPEFPILPGVLTLEILRKTIAGYFESRETGAGESLKLRQVRAVKFSHYLRPGARWRSRVERTGDEGGLSQWRGELRNEAGEIAAAAKFVFEKAGS